MTFHGTDEQLINALRHMAHKRPITRAEKAIVSEAAFRLLAYTAAPQTEAAAQEDKR